MKSISSLMSLKGRVALVTGGGGHLGRVLCDALAEQGAAIAVLDKNREDCHRTVTEIEVAHGVPSLSVPVDLENEEQLREVPGKILDELGAIDILVNCAALVGTSSLEGWAVPFHEQNSDTWRKALEVNLTAPFILTQVCAEALKRSRKGCVVNIGSIYGVCSPDMSLYEGTEMGNPAAYAASKGGLMQLTRWLAAVMAPDVRVNAVTPGGIRREGQTDVFVSRYTRNTMLKRMATEDDIKGAVVYLASDMSAYVTGQNLIVDGGWTI